MGYTFRNNGSNKKGKGADYFSVLVSVIGISVPSFVIAGMLQLYAVNIHKEMLLTYNIPIGRFLITGWDSPVKKILPVMSLGFGTIAVVTRLMRTKMVETLEQDYIRLAIAKGVTPFNVVFKHAIKCYTSSNYSNFSINSRDYDRIICY